jgi:hypothetical protein
MDDAITGMPAETILHGALELSKNSWLLALQFPDRAQPSLHPIVAISVVASVLSESATTISSTHSTLETAASIFSAAFSEMKARVDHPGLSCA